MSAADITPTRFPLLLNAGIAAAFALLGAAGAWWWEGRSGSLSSGQRAEIEQVVHDYLMAHPEVLPKAMAELESRQNASQLAKFRPDLERASAGTVLGNPQGRVTLIEFTDYACGFCRRSVDDVDALIAANPDLRVIVRELPILTPSSADAAKMAIAAAEQGRYAQFHKAMFEAGNPSAKTIASAAATAGLDMDRALRIAADPGTEAELVRNLDLAKQLGFSGTPSWVVGDAMLSGAVGRDSLAEAIASAQSGTQGT